MPRTSYPHSTCTTQNTSETEDELEGCIYLKNVRIRTFAVEFLCVRLRVYFARLVCFVWLLVMYVLISYEEGNGNTFFILVRIRNMHKTH